MAGERCSIAIAAALGAEVARIQLEERERSAATIGALEALVAEIETRHAVDVAALQAELAEMRAAIKRLKEAQAEGGPRQLRVVS